MDKKLWYLKGCNLFEQLSPEEISRLEGRARLRSFPRRAIIYAPTEPGQSVLILARGRVKIKDLTPEGKETILAFIDEGEIFGELALVDRERRHEYAEAVTEAVVLLLARDDVLWLMERRPDVSLSITTLIGLRRRRIENRLRNVLFLPSRERMLRLLLELLESHGGPDGQIRLPLSHQEIASLIGVTRETVTVILGQLQTAGLVSIRRRRITIPDQGLLAREVSGEGRVSRTRKFRPVKKDQEM